MALLGSLQVRLGLETGTFSKGLTGFTQRATKDAKKLADSFSPLDKIKSSLAGIAAGLTAAAFGNMVRGALDASDALGEVAGRLGLASQELQSYRVAAQFAGAESATLDKSLGFLARNLGNIRSGLDATGKKTSLLESLGVTPQDIQSGSVARVFEQVVAGLSRIQDPATRSAAAMQLFGKSAGQLNLLFGEGAPALARARDLIRDLGLQITDIDTARAGELNDNFDKLGLLLGSVKNKITAELTPALLQLTGQLLQTATTGESMGQRITAGVQGTLTGINVLLGSIRAIGNTFSAAFNLIQAGFAGLGATVTGFAAEVVKTIGTRIPEAFNATLSVAGVFLSTLQQGFADFATAAANVVVAGMNTAAGAIEKLVADSAQKLNLFITAANVVAGTDFPTIAAPGSIGRAQPLKRLPLDPVDLSGLQLPTFGGDLATGLGDYSTGLGNEARRQLEDAAVDYRDIVNSTTPLLDGSVLPPKPIADDLKEAADYAAQLTGALTGGAGAGGGGSSAGGSRGGAAGALETVSEKAAEASREIQLAGIQVQSAWTGAMQNIGTAIDQFVQTGKLDFKSLVNSIIAELASSALKNAFNSLLQGIGSALGLGGSSASNPVGTTTNIVGSILKLFSGSSFEGGGYTGPGPRSGGVDGRGGRFAIVHPNETVIDHDRVRATGRTGRRGGVNLSVPITLMPGVSKEELAQILPLLKRDIIQTIPNLIARGGRAAAAYGQ